MKKIILIIGLGVFYFSGYSQNETGVTSYSFSLPQAIEFALQNQNNVKNALLDEEISKNKVKEITGIGLPQINGSFDVKKFIEIPTSLVPAQFFGGPPGSFAAVKFGTTYNATAGFDASQLIFSGDYFLGLQASKVYQELTVKVTQRTKIETNVAVTKAYYTVLVNEERMALMDANIVRLKKTMDDTKILFDNGLVEKIDYDRLTVAYNNLTLEREKIERLLKVGLLLLKYQMGMDVADNLILTDKLADVKFDFTTQVSAEKFDYSKRVEFNLYETQQTLARLDLKRNKFSYLPTAFAYASINGMAQRNEFNIFNTEYRWYPTSLIGAKVNIPIFSGFQRNFKYQQSKLSLQKAENNLDFIKKSIDLELASSTTVLQNATATLENQKKNMAIAEDVFRVSKLKYEQGVGSNMEVIVAETALKESQTNYYNALFEALLAKIDFDKANGNLK
ncbi:MAG: TolC family protein [Bacteroidia bacterium]